MPTEDIAQRVCCAAILAGGKSSRMGREKALIEIEGQPLIARVASILAPIFPQVCVVTSSPDVARAAGLPAIEDTYAGSGPLGGIHAALTHYDAPTFCVACDMPFLSASLIEHMASNYRGGVLVPEAPDGLEPLHAVYAPSLAQSFGILLGSGSKTPSLRRLLAEVGFHAVPLVAVQKYDPTLRCFANWNSPEDIYGAQKGA